jgi:hypothetical protein
MAEPNLWGNAIATIVRENRRIVFVMASSRISRCVMLRSNESLVDLRGRARQCLYKRYGQIG